jgi:hypothetical protein
MSANQKKQPWGDAFAVVPPPSGSSEDAKDQWLEIGVAWYNERDGRHSLSFTLAIEPVVWKDPQVVRNVVIQKRNNAR